MIAVRFVEHYGPYNAGEIAGLNQETAAALVAAGKAKLVKTGEMADEREPTHAAAPLKRGRRVVVK